jgi:Predicted GTPase
VKQIKKIKVVIAGPFAAGKTQFINTVSEIKTVKTERRIQQSSERSVKDYTTVAMDFGRMRIDDEHELYLFGTPGQFRFDFIWEILGEGTFGVIVLMDSTDPTTFHEARKIINFFQSRFPVPIVVGANKQDLPNAWSPEDVRIALDIDEEEIPVIPVSAIDKESVKNALLTLFEIIKANLTR